MIAIFRTILLSVFLLLSTNFSFGQTNEIKIRFIGNCGLHFTDGINNIYFDFPYKSGAHGYMQYDEVEIEKIESNAVFIFTHRHADHYSKKILKKFKRKKYDPWNTDKLKEISDSIPGFSIEAYKTKHKVFGISFRHYSYLVSWHGKKIFLSGDTETADTIALQQNLDLAFVPAWLINDAVKKGIKLKEISRKIMIYHIGPKDKITTDEKDPRVELLTTQGTVIPVP